MGDSNKSWRFSSDNDPPLPLASFGLRHLLFAIILISIPLSSFVEMDIPGRSVSVSIATGLSVVFALVQSRPVPRAGMVRIMICMGLGVVIYSISILLLIALLTGPREWGMLSLVPFLGSLFLTVCAMVGTIMALDALS